MKILLAGDHSAFKQVAHERPGIPYVMGSFYYMSTSPTDGSGEDWKAEYTSHPHCRGAMFDSGAFTYIKQGGQDSAENVDWYAYATEYAEWVRDNNIQRWIELDLDNVMGLQYTRELRAHMEDIVGRDCIPVWHRTRGASVFRDLAREYDFMCMGGFPWDEIGPSEYHMLPKFIDEAHERGCRIHGLGFQPGAEKLKRYQFDSTDSTNWIFDGFGSWRRFDGTGLERIDHEKSVSSDMYAHNLREWAKFARYMDGQNEPDIGVDW